MKLLSLALILLYAVVFFFLKNKETYQLYYLFGLSIEGLQKGEVWQLLTYALLHGGWIHLGLNCAALFLLGAKAQQLLGGRKAWTVLVIGVLVGGLTQLLLGCFVPPMGEVLLVGISGGVMALLLALTTHSPYTRLKPLPLHSGNLGMGCLLASLLLLLMYPALGVPLFSQLGEKVESVLQFDLGSISHACHLGGGFVGWVFGKYFCR